MPLEQDFAGCLVDEGRLVGFISVRRMILWTKKGIFKSSVPKDVVRWRVAMAPAEPWNEGYEPLSETREELSASTFVYVGKKYSITWAGPDMSNWILGLILEGS
jgi:hypothetical protein